MKTPIDRRLFTILMIVFVQMLGASMILPILPLYAQRQFGLTPETITLLVSVFFAAQFLAGPTIGRLSDNYGRLPVLIVSQIGTAVSFVMLALAPGPFLLFAARTLDGITGGNIIVAQAYVTDVTPREKRTEALGYVFAAFGLGFIFGPALGGVLSAAFGPRVPFIVAAVAAALTVLLTWVTLDETVTPEQRETNRRVKQSGLEPAEVLRNFPLLLIFIAGFVGQFALGLLQSTFSLYAEVVLFPGYDDDATNLGIGLLLAVVGVSQFVTQTFLLPRMIGRVGDALLVIIGTLVRSLGLLIFAVVTSPWLGAFGSLFFAAGLGMMMPSLQSLATKTVGDQVRGGVLGLYQSIVSLSIIISTAIAGVMFNISPITPYWIGLLLSMLSLIPALVIWQRARRDKLAPEHVPVGLD
jgi:DHA1 family tetracycline resistance protein-like MFS transporter